MMEFWDSGLKLDLKLARHVRGGGWIIAVPNRKGIGDAVREIERTYNVKLEVGKIDTKEGTGVLILGKRFNGQAEIPKIFEKHGIKVRVGK